MLVRCELASDWLISSEWSGVSRFSLFGVTLLVFWFMPLNRLVSAGDFVLKGNDLPLLIGRFLLESWYRLRARFRWGNGYSLFLFFLEYYLGSLSRLSFTRFWSWKRIVCLGSSLDSSQLGYFVECLCFHRRFARECKLIYSWESIFSEASSGLVIQMVGSLFPASVFWIFCCCPLNLDRQAIFYFYVQTHFLFSFSHDKVFDVHLMCVLWCNFINQCH